MKVEIGRLKALFVAFEKKVGKRPYASPAKHKDQENVVKGLFEDIDVGRKASAYQTMSAGFRKSTPRKVFEDLIEPIPRTKAGMKYQFEYKFRGLAKENVFECDVLIREPIDRTTRANIVLRMVEEAAMWKIDDIVEFVDLREKK